MAKEKKTTDVQDYEPSELETFLELFKIPLATSDVENHKLSYEQRCLFLNATYDTTLIKLFFKSKADENKGIAANVTVLERARLELVGLEETHARTNGDAEDTGETHSMGYGLPAVEEKDAIEA